MHDCRCTFLLINHCCFFVNIRTQFINPNLTPLTLLLPCLPSKSQSPSNSSEMFTTVRTIAGCSALRSALSPRRSVLPPLCQLSLNSPSGTNRSFFTSTAPMQFIKNATTERKKRAGPKYRNLLFEPRPPPPPPVVHDKYEYVFQDRQEVGFFFCHSN